MPEFDNYRDNYHDDINAAIRFSGKSQTYFTQVKARYLGNELTQKFGANNNLKVLDVGCGHGDIHPFIHQAYAGIELTGIDVAGTVVDEAASRYPENDYRVYDGNRIPFEDETFDSAFAICVMHHVPPPQWEQFLREMLRVVKEDGVLLVFEHNPSNPITRRIVNNCPLDENAVLLPAKQLSDLCQKTGWKDVRNQFILFTPFSTKPFEQLDRWLGAIPLGAQYFTKGVRRANKRTRL